MNKKQIIYTVIFWTMLLVLLFALNESLKFVASKSVQYESRKINGLLNHTLDAEIMIFGSSVAIVHFDDSVIRQRTGLSAFNAGIDGANFQQNIGLINEFIAYTKTCKFLVLSFTVHDYTKRSEIYELYRYLAHVSNPNIYQSLSQIDPLLMFQLRYIPGYAFTVYDQQFYDRCKDGVSIIRNPESYRSVTGWFPVDESKFDSTSMNGISDSSFVLPVDSNIKQDIIDLRNRIANKGINLLIVLPPIEKGMHSKIANLNEYRTNLLMMAGDSTCFLDYSQSDLANQRNLFYNFTHLNKKGAQLFSVKFADDLKLLVK